MAKLTFSLDDDTVATLRKVAARTRKPQSMVIREAVAYYAEREEKLPDAERDRLLKVLSEFKRTMTPRPRGEVEKELRELRASRRSSGHLTPVD